MSKLFFSFFGMLAGATSAVLLLAQYKSTQGLLLLAFIGAWWVIEETVTRLANYFTSRRRSRYIKGTGVDHVQIIRARLAGKISDKEVAEKLRGLRARADAKIGSASNPHD